jgi:general nucleoside transport system ATP-binding protein
LPSEGSGPLNEQPAGATGAVAPAVAMLGIRKRFDRVQALDGVDLALAGGGVHAVVGENGAGKTTLMHVLAGHVARDAGRILVDGHEAEIRSVGDANRLGIAMVHQHFMLFPSLTVAENLTITREPVRRGLIDRDAARGIVSDLSTRFGLGVDPDARVGSLSVGALQRVEILRALYREARVLILDEPTAVLTPPEADRLFETIHGLAADGRTVVFVSHHLDEVLAHADRITVLRDGRVTAEVQAAGTTIRDLAGAMVGRNVVVDLERPAVEPGRPVLELRALRADGLGPIDLTVRAGEIVGVAGVAGNGQSELADVIAGVLPATGGTIAVDGTDVSGAKVVDRRAAGLCYIPEDRYRQGLAPDASIRDNLAVGRHAGKPGARRRLLDVEGIARRCERVVRAFGIKAPDLDLPVRTLSGGNAQRVVVARELADPHALTIASQPTRGIDIAATQFVRGALLDRRATGSGVLLVSSDLEEILTLSDRIVVLYGGRIAGEVRADEADEIGIGLLMAGATTADARAGRAGAPG